MMQAYAHPTILIVDDTPSNLAVVVSLFEEHSYRISIAQDGGEGIRRAQLLQPDLILLDVMMPGMDGFETCRRLKMHGSTRDIPVIFMTALAMPEQKVEGFRAGAVDYVTKPLQIDEIMTRVQTHLKLHAAQKKLAEHNKELERRVSERTAELESREREFRTLAENLPDNLARYDTQCRLTYMNSRLERFLGKTLEERIGKTPLESSSHEVYVGYQSRLEATLKTGQPSEMEFSFSSDDNGVRYHYISFVAERNDRGEIVSVLAIGRDVTERKLAERELHLLNHALDHAFDATYLIGEDLRLRYVNEAAVRALGYSREELLSMTLPDIDANFLPEKLREIMRQAVENGGALVIESIHRRSDGTTFPVEVGAKVFNYEGEVLHLTTVRDISDRKRAQEVLIKREREFRTLAENIPDNIIRYDRNGRKIYINSATARLIGCKAEDLLGQTPEETPKDKRAMKIDELSKRLRTVLETGEPQTLEVALLHAENGMQMHNIRLVAERDEQGGVVGALMVGRDISSIKRAERELKESHAQLRGLAARREEVREEERKYIAREVHDELGQILTGLQLNISVLKHKYSSDSEPLREHLKDTVALTDRALAVARNVASALRPAALDMGIVSALEWLSSRFASNTGITCTVGIEDKEVHFNEACAIAIYRSVQESLTNIARHAKANRVDITMARSGDEYVLKVRDNGCGFDMGGKKENSFGLVGIRERAMLLGGKFSINSWLGVGTEIEVHIPVIHTLQREA